MKHHVIIVLLVCSLWPYTAEAKDCPVYTVTVEGTNLALQVGDPYVPLRNFTGEINQQIKHCSNPGGKSISFVSVLNGKCFEIPDCNRNELGLVALCDGGSNQEFVFESDRTAHAACNPEIYVGVSKNNLLDFTNKEHAAKFELVTVEQE